MEAVERVDYLMFPSSRGHMLLHFDSRADRDEVVDLSLIEHDGGHVTLERPEDTSNRFIIRRTGPRRGSLQLSTTWAKSWKSTQIVSVVTTPASALSSPGRHRICSWTSSSWAIQARPHP